MFKSCKNKILGEKLKLKDRTREEKNCQGENRKGERKKGEKIYKKWRMEKDSEKGEGKK